MEAGVSDGIEKGPGRNRTVKKVMTSSSGSTPPFLVKTYMVVEDPVTDDVISWNGDGTAFVVWKTAEFAKDVLPTLFKHCNFSSFVRQLNTYGFRKISTSRWEFHNEKFQKGEKEKLSQIRRRKAWTTTTTTAAMTTTNSKQQPATAAINERNQASANTANHHEHDEEDQRSSSSNSSSSEFNTLIDENKRLKIENGVLNSELASMKNKCKELLNLVAMANKQCTDTNKDFNSEKKQEEEMADKRPKLFGVRLEVEDELVERERNRKRSKKADQESAADDHNETAKKYIMLSQSCK